jgi:hypothetical protein
VKIATLLVWTGVWLSLLLLGLSIMFGIFVRPF